MATQWVLGKVSDALQPTIHSGVSTAGSYAGGAFNAVGNGINGVGQSIGSSIKRYGDGCKDYGNGFMDWTNASAPRAQTAANPLGLGSSKTSGRSAVTSPSIYSAPTRTGAKSTPAKPTQKKIASAPVKKALPKKIEGSVPRPTSAVNPGANRKAVTAVKPNTVQKSNRDGNVRTPVKAGTTNINKAKPSSAYKPNHVGAANPLGLS